MPVIAIDIAMHHLLAEPEDQVLVQAQLEAAEGAAMKFLNRHVYLDQVALDTARAGVAQTMRQAKAANVEAIAAADLEQDHSVRCRLLEHARAALAEAYDQADAVAYGMVINPAIQAACLLKLGHLFANREEVVTGATAVELPLASQHLLMPYRIRMGVMQAGKLRHRIDIQEFTPVRDAGTGEFGASQWLTRWERCPARVEPLSTRDLVAAQAGQSEATGRMIIRYRPGVVSAMRIIYRGEVYSIEGPPLEDKDSGREYLTLLVSKGVKDE